MEIFNSKDYPSSQQIAYAKVIAEFVDKLDEFNKCVTRWDYHRFISANVDEYHNRLHDGRDKGEGDLGMVDFMEDYLTQMTYANN